MEKIYTKVHEGNILDVHMCRKKTKRKIPGLLGKEDLSQSFKTVVLWKNVIHK